MSLLFILLLAFSVAALAVTDDQRFELIKKAWNADPDQASVIEKKFNCCHLEKVDDTCKAVSIDINLYFHDNFVISSANFG